MNKITIIGNLTQDPQKNTTATGLTVCSFTVAVNRKFPVNGEKVTDYFRVQTWRQLADICGKYLTKGRKVAVIGELQAKTYQNKEGFTKMSLEIQADEVEFVSEPAAKFEAPKPSNVNTVFPEDLPDYNKAEEEAAENENEWEFDDWQ